MKKPEKEEIVKIIMTEVDMSPSRIIQTNAAAEKIMDLFHKDYKPVGELTNNPQDFMKIADFIGNRITDNEFQILTSIPMNHVFAIVDYIREMGYDAKDPQPNQG